MRIPAKKLHLTGVKEMKHTLYNIIQEGKANAKKALAILIDPDKLNNERLNQTIELAVKSKVDYFFVGGSLVVTDTLDTTVAAIKKQSTIPVILFPGSPDQITAKADALLYLSLILLTTYLHINYYCLLSHIHNGFIL